MSGYAGNQGFYDNQSGWNTGGDPKAGWAPADGRPSGFSYDVGSNPDFGTEPEFETFDYSTSQPQPPPAAAAAYYPSYSGHILTPDANAAYYAPSTNNFEDEPPLLEELGINFDHIWQKTVAVLNPLKDAEATILQETDLAGPLVFCLSFGGLLLLSGKVHFGYIYGIGVLGCLGLYLLLNLMSIEGISMGCTISVLGYCLLPMVVLSGVSILLSLKGAVGTALAVVTVLWCAISASKLFVTALAMSHQQPLVAYPCALLYGVFALITIF